MKLFLNKYACLLAFVLALVGTLMSLFFSEILHLPPCVLCWYQRIFMYPIVAILAVGILRKDKNVAYYVLPLSIVGLIISIYHNLLYYSILPENVAPCIQGISCTTRQIEWFGFVTIPLLSFIAFATITILMVSSFRQRQINDK